MCPRTVGIKKNKKQRISKHFDYDLYKRLVDEASSLGVYAIKLTWLGEPLMNPKIIDMVKYAKDKGIEDVIMNTNAVLLNEGMSRGLIKAGIDRIFFSFDSPEKESYEKIRVGANYDEVLKNIIAFHGVRCELNSLNPVMRVSMVILPGNKSLLENFKSMFSKIVDIVAYGGFIDHDKDYGFLKKRQDIRFACASLWQRMLIRADGEIAVCCHDHNAIFGIGNMEHTTIAEAWNSRRYNELRKQHQNFEWHEIDFCSRCPVVEFGTSGSV